MINVVSLSGGKDSVALWLWARRTGLDPVAIYSDTLWEWDGHAPYLDLLEASVGPIRERTRPQLSFAGLVRVKGTFPGRVRKFCTEDLKLKPFADALDRLRHETGDDCQVLVGVRREESKSRADPVLTPEREWAKHYDCEVWRPILDWTLLDVVEEHHRAGIPLHPLYHHGAERVGCFPCVNAPKSELALVARLQPSRITEIREMEAETGQTMFTRDRRTEKARLMKSGVPESEAGPSVVPIGIDEAVLWGNTERGGEQLLLVPAFTGCARWGICEAPHTP